MKSEEKIKILFLLPSLVSGGAERVISFVAQGINKEIFTPTLLIAGFRKDSAFDVSNVNIIYLNKKRILTALPSIIINIYKIEPDIVVSSISHVNTAMSAISPFFKRTKFIGRESTVLSKRNSEKKVRKYSPFQLLPNGFKNLDAIICQSKDMADDMITNFKIPKNLIYIINNPISSLPDLKPPKSLMAIRRFITVGRLTEVKGHLRILDILSKYDQPFNYTIIGEGSLKSEIFKKAKALGVYDKINHIPFTEKVNDYIADHDIFLQGSYVEGFPNALLESCVVGTPVIAFKAPGGTQEIIEDGVNGFAVDTEEDYLEKLNDSREWNPEKVRASVYDKFNKDIILKQYEDLFVNILKT